MKDRIPFIVVVILGLASAAVAHQGHPDHGAAPASASPSAPPEKSTFSGEVMDLACYLQHPDTGHGAKHAACAQQCLNKGLPAGLKVGGQLYLLLGRGHGSIDAQVAPFGGRDAKVTGTVVERDGLKAIVVDDIVGA